MTPFAFNTTPAVRFGSGALAQITPFAATLGDHVLVVTDAGMVATGLVARAEEALQEAGIGVTRFDGVVADPPIAVIEAAVAAAMEAGATGVLGFGGGSSLDAAKLVALLAVGKEQLGDIWGLGNVKGPRLPLILVPTTAGTGSEVTPVAIVTTGASEKMGVVSPILLPDAAILDPDLTLGLPAPITAATGIDAMVHAIEAYASASPNNNPVSRALACEALRLMGASLERAVHDGSDLAARSDMLLGSMLAGQAFANAPVAAVHALAYPIGGHFKIPHGLSNALVLSHVLRFNAVTSPGPYAELLPHALPEAPRLEGQAGAAALADGLAALSDRCGLPKRLRDVDIPADALPAMARDAMNQTRLLVNNPRPVTEADALAIYEAAW